MQSGAGVDLHGAGNDLPVTLTAMDTHKTDAEPSFLSSGDEVRHILPVRVDDLCFIRNAIRKHPMRSPGALLFAIPERRGNQTVENL